MKWMVGGVELGKTVEHGDGRWPTADGNGQPRYHLYPINGSGTGGYGV